MGNVVVVGAQWGDEGKGKIVDWLSERADVIARFQGGHNAGHTLVIDGAVYKLSLLPSGIVRPGKLSVIGNGVVLDPWALLAEIEKLRGQGVAIEPESLLIAENAPLILPLHQDLDRMREEAAGAAKIGTTGRGIGPAYEDKVGRRSIRVADLGDEATLETRLDRLLAHHDALRRGPRGDADRPGGAEGAAGGGGAEGAALCGAGLEGAGRDPPRGQAHPLRGGAGLAPRHRLRHLPLRHLLEHAGRHGRHRHRHGAGGGGVRARHRQGLHHAGRRGAVPGGAHGRDRRAARRARARVRHRHRAQAPLRLVRRGAGAADLHHGRRHRHRAHQARRARRLRGAEDLRRLRARRAAPRPPAHRGGAAGAGAPIYETLPGWSETTAGARSWAELPAQAIKYVRRIEELIGCPVALLSTSPERDDTILVTDPFAA